MTMNNLVSGPQPAPDKPARLPWYEWLAAVALLLAVGFFLYGMWSDYQTSTPLGAVKTHLTAAELEQQYGVRIRLIGVTAAGGLIDFRYKIVDLAKARTLLEDHEQMPLLAVPGTNTVLRMPESMMEHSDLAEGQLFYAHYPNAGGAIRPGTPVSVIFGDLQVDAIAAQ